MPFLAIGLAQGLPWGADVMGVELRGGRHALPTDAEAHLGS